MVPLDGPAGQCYGVGLKPADLILKLRKGGKPEPGYLFLGAEPFYRGRARQAVRQAALGETAEDVAVEELDLAERSLVELVEEARAMSLFASDRLVIGRNAEQAVPKAASNAAKAAQRVLEDYFSDPTPGTVVLIEAVKYDSQDRDDKARLARMAKFFGPVPVHVELDALSAEEAMHVAGVLSKRMSVRFERGVLSDLVEMLAADAFRIENELEKLSVFVGTDREVTRADLEMLVPEARQSGLFDFSQAIAERDRASALGLVDTMARAGTHWPLQLNLIAGLFRQALAAKELGLRDARAIGKELASYGLRIWPARSRQIAGIVTRFEEGELRKALIALFEADRHLRSAQPSDRLVVEMLVMKLTG